MIPNKNVPLPGMDLTPFSEEGGAGCVVLVAAKDLERATKILEEARESAEESEEESENGEKDS